MESIHISLKKRLFISIAFFCFFAVLLLAITSVKNKKPIQNTNSIIPTLIPVKTQPGTAPTSLSPASVEPAPAASSADLGSVVFNIAKADIPTSATIYEQTPTIIPADIISHLQSKLLPGGEERVINTPQGQTIFMKGEGKTLLFYLYSRTVVYTNTQTDSKNSASIDDLTKKATTFIDSLSLSIDGTSSQIKYYTNKTGDLVETRDVNAATTIDVSFRELIHGLVVFRQFGNDSRAHVWFTKNGDIVKFTYFYSPLYAAKTSLNLPSLEEAKNEILDNKGIIVELGNEYQQKSLANPSKTTFTNASVGYFNDIDNRMLYPIFVFEGTTIIQNLTYPITVYLPIAQ
jgi:hypothetical protein